MAQADRITELLLELESPGAPPNRARLLARALRTASALVDADATAAVIASPKKPAERLVLHAGSDLPALLPLAADGSEALRALALEAKPVAWADLSEQPEYAEGDACPGVEAGPTLFLPIVQSNGEPAYLAVYRKRGRAKFTTTETHSLLLLAAWLGAALDRRRLVALATRGEGTTANGTGGARGTTPGDRAIRAALHKEIRRAHRHGQELCLVLASVDPRAGDADPVPSGALDAIAEDLGGRVRAFDTLARIAPERTAIVLPQTAREGGLDVAERMRFAIAAQGMGGEAAGAVTATFAVACFPHDGVDAESLWAVTERILKAAQAHGGNCVETTARRAA